MSDFEVTFLSHGRKAVVEPNPLYPDGQDIDVSRGAAVACLAELPYPAECCGVLLVRCKTCGVNAAITTAGRPDDPRTLKLPCKGAKP